MRTLVALMVVGVLGGAVAAQRRPLQLHADKEVAVLAEIGNQYEGALPGDPSLQPYFAMAAASDIPIGIHVGTGPPEADIARHHGR
jgi:predicted TIM-barrel fold metal-dependent hydrolase